LTPRGTLKDCHHEIFSLFNDPFLLNTGRHPIIRAGTQQFAERSFYPKRQPGDGYLVVDINRDQSSRLT